MQSLVDPVRKLLLKMLCLSLSTRLGLLQEVNKTTTNLSYVELLQMAALGKV